MCGSNLCHRAKHGNPMVRMVQSAATSSASGVEWLTHDCLLLCPDIGKNEFDPRMAKNMPDVDRWDCVHPAKSASAY